MYYYEFYCCVVDCMLCCSMLGFFGIGIVGIDVDEFDCV